MEKSKHMKTLWAVISGSNQPASLDVVGPFIEKAKDRLISGICYFKPRCGDATLPSNSPFATVLSHTIFLTENQANELVQVYKENEFRGTSEQFDNLLKSKHLHSGLLAELVQFYHHERMYLLHCIELLIKKSQDPKNRYHLIFKEFLETYDSKQELKNSLLSQLKSLKDAKPPQHPSLTIQPLSKWWWNANINERSLLLQCLIHYSDFKPFGPEELLDILSVSDDIPRESEEEYYRVSYLQDALAVKIINNKQNLDSLVTQNDAIEEQISKLSSKAEYSPILLSWMLMHYTSEKTVKGSKFQQFGQKAVEQRVLKVIADVTGEQTFQGTSSLREIICSTFSQLLASLVDCFDTERLGNREDLRHGVCNVLRGSEKAAQNFWTPEQGLNLVWIETLAQFPAEMNALVDLTKAVAQSGEQNKRKVAKEVMELPCYADSMDSLPDSALKWTSAGVVILLQAHYPFKHTGNKEVLIPRGATGSVDGKTIRWHVKVNFYDLAIAEIQQLLQQASFGLSAVKADSLNRVRRILSFLELVFPELETISRVHAQRLQHLILSMIERFGPLYNATFELLASCFSCLASAVTKSNAADVAGKLFSTMVLPSVERLFPEIANSPVVPGVVGTVLAGVECSQGFYPMTVAFVKLMDAFVQAELAEERVMVPSTLFILREVFPFLMSRQYVSIEERDAVVDACLDWLLRLLQTDVGRLRNIAVRTLLDSNRNEAESIVAIASYGSSFAEVQLLKQTNWEDVKGRGLILSRQIRIALSILNQVLNDRQATDQMSHLETVLSNPSSTVSVHFVTVLAYYIFYRFDLRLATLALKVLRSCANRWRNVSLLACLGHDANFIRSVWLNSLESDIEDAGLVRSIVRLMTDAVTSQPGLMHMLVNGDERCLKSIANLLLDGDNVEALKLVHHFWSQRCSPAIEFFRKRANFWTQLSKPILSSEKSAEMKKAALIFHLIAIELYNAAEKDNAELSSVLKQLQSHLTEWSDLVLSTLPLKPTKKDEDKSLLSGWSDFLVTLSHYGPKMDEKTRVKIQTDVLDKLIELAQNVPHPPQLGKLAELFWMLLLVEKKSDLETVKKIGNLLTVLAERELISYPARFQVAVIVSAVLTVRYRGTVDQLENWMRPAALCAHSCLLQMPRILLADSNPRASCITSLCLSLLAELAPSARDLSAMQETFLLQSLVSTVQFCIHHRRGWEVAEAALAVLLAVAGTEQGSAVLTQLQLDHSLWLPLEAIWQVQPSIYRLGLQLCTTLLGRQRHFFLNQALTLAGVHQSPMTDILLQLRHPNKENVLVAIDVMALLRQLSVFQQTWRLQHGASMQGVLQASSAAVYFGISHLIRSGGALTAADKDGDASHLPPGTTELQAQILNLVSLGLALLNCYSPPLAALLTEDGIDVAKWERHLSPTFGTPSLDHLDSPPSLSFGTLNTVASHCLRILSKPGQPCEQHAQLTLVLEQSLSLLLSQALLYLLDPRLCPQEKQMLKRELGAELGSFVESIRRQAQRGLRSPAANRTPPTAAGHQSFLKLVGHVVQRIFK